jgi:hypothetical protein
VLILPAAVGAQDDGGSPCPAGVPASATLRAEDIEDFGGSLTATHTIGLRIDTPEDSAREFNAELPEGVVARRIGPDPGFRSDTPGPVYVRATWSEFDPGSGSFCRASTEGTFNLEAPRPIQYTTPPPRKSTGTGGATWILHVPKNADLRPVQVRIRGVQHARLPGASAPLKVATWVLRRGDKGLTYAGRSSRTLVTGGWHYDIGFSKPSWLYIHQRDFARVGPFGLDLEIVQAGRRIARNRFVGGCGRYGICHYRSAGAAR